ncbi:MAG TPA: GDCCVxC domain-containing (seleno)protein [Bradyrhizobium sp.]|nr:GDCCVxC domain-containing (seleno)protein [Bradyrhizobium sp.]
MQLESTLTCPNCGHQSVETMSTNACQFFYDCKGCGERLKPHAGDCCVFCSYGSVPCPPIQQSKGCCLEGLQKGILRAYAERWKMQN